MQEYFFSDRNFDIVLIICYNKRKAFIIIYLNVLADTQIKDLLPAYRTIIAKNLRFYAIINTLSALSARKEVEIMDYILSFVLSVAASVVGYYICKWLDGHKSDN